MCPPCGGGTIIFRENGDQKSIRNLTIASNSMCVDCVFLGLKPKENVTQHFLFYLLKENIEILLRKFTASTKTETIRKSALIKYPIKFPQQSLVDKFNNFCEPIFELQKNNEQIIQKLLRLQKCWVESLD